MNANRLLATTDAHRRTRIKNIYSAVEKPAPSGEQVSLRRFCSRIFNPCSSLFIGGASFIRISSALLLGVAVLAGCGKGRPDQAVTRPELPAAKVRAIAVESRTVPAFEDVVGTVRARLRSTVEAKASGRILELPVTLGQKVKAGDLLARLDAPEIKARLQQAEAGLQQAERDWKRISGLYEQQAATRADYDAADSRLQLAKAGVAEARALLDYVEVQAPFDGVITRKSADVGDLAAPGKPLVELEDPSQLQMEADVPEAIAADIKPGARMNVRVGESSSEISASVAEIAPNADPVSRTFRVKLDLPSTADSALRTPHSALIMSGQFARLAVPVGQTTSIRVPTSAVVQRGQMEIVFAIENQRAQMHLVKTGRQFGDGIEILSGLDSGDSVVVNGAAQLVDGQPVSVE